MDTNDVIQVTNELQELITSAANGDNGGEPSKSSHLYPQDLNKAADVLVTIAEVTQEAEGAEDIDEISEVLMFF